jgi:mannose-6-phosphate isomerase-like protein (cupin superfamily)
MISKVNLNEKLGMFDQMWSPRIVGQLNDHQVKVVKVQGEFVWHKHEDIDEMFFVVSGELSIELPGGQVDLHPGEFLIIPKGLEHKPVAKSETHIMLLEPEGVVNTGDAQGDERTQSKEIWI